MPHIILQYSDNINNQNGFGDLFSQIHNVLSDRAGINPNNCKSRAIKVQDYYIGDGGNSHAFAHIELSIYKGRSQDLLQEIGKEILTLMQKYIKDVFSELNVQYTHEIKEINSEHYYKA